MDGTVVITLLRHGMTAANLRGEYIGWSNPPLSDVGRNELKQLKEFVVSDEIQTVFSSDLIRCVETAGIYFPKLPIYKTEELRELNFGKWEGKSYEELKNLTGYRYWLDHLFESAPEAGEHFTDFTQRIDRAFENIKQHMLNKKLTNIAIVAHGGVLRYLLLKLMKSTNTYFDWKVPYGSGYQLSWSESAFRRDELCTSLQVVPQMERPHG